MTLIEKHLRKYYNYDQIVQLILDYDGDKITEEEIKKECPDYDSALDLLFDVVDNDDFFNELYYGDLIDMALDNTNRKKESA